MTAQGTRYIAATTLHLDLYVKLATMRQISNHVIGIDDFNIMRRLNITGANNTFSVFTQAQRHFITVVKFENNTLEIKQNVDDVFVNTFNRRVLMKNTSDSYLSRRKTRHGRKQHAAQGI